MHKYENTLLPFITGSRVITCMRYVYLGDAREWVWLSCA